MDLGILLGSQSGAVGTVSLSYRSAIVASEYMVIADESTFVIDRGALIEAGGKPTVSADRSENRTLALVSQTREFLTAIRDGHAATTSVDRILPVMRVLDELDRQRIEGLVH
jgi:2-hydroxy-4-carboxymuconate semialdehyde hemiacetal dehydrogenase